MKNLREHLAILTIYTLFTGLLLNPLPRHLATGLLEAQTGDPLLQIWVVQWNIHKLTGSLAHYFDANIFYPYANTFAYHDHMFALGLLGLPIYLISHNPILTYNALLMLSFVLSAYGMYLFCKEITGNGHAAFLAGGIFGFLPYRFAHLDHLNLLSIQWLPFCLLFLTRVFFLNTETPQFDTFRRNVSMISLFWLFFLLQALTSFNYLFMLTFIVGIYLVTTMFFQWQQAGGQAFACCKLKFTLLISGGCLVGLLLLPFMIPYLRANQEMGFQRTLAEAASLSARIQDYLVAPESNWLYGQLTRKFQSLSSPYPREQMLFYGILPMILAILGMFGGTRRIEEQRRLSILRRTYFILFIITGILSLGPSTVLLGKTFALPYAWLYHLLPGFKSMRVPARFGLLAVFALTLLAALGLSRLSDLIKKWVRFGDKPMTTVVTTGLIGGIILLEYFSLAKPLNFYPGTKTTIPAIYQWLAQHPEVDRLIELPVNSVKDDFEYTYYSTFHWKRIVNGRSAFIPSGIAQLFEEMRSFPTPRAIDLLKSIGVQYVLLHTSKLAQPLLPTLPNGVSLVQAFDRDLLLALLPKTSGISRSAGDFTPRKLTFQYQLPSTLRPAEQYTFGFFLKPTLPEAWSPLPQEKTTLQLTWRTATQPLYQEIREIRLPIFIPAGEQVVVPMQITTPPQIADYQLVIEPQTALFEPQAFTRRITLASDVLDSRRPGKLQAEFLSVDLPALWERGKPCQVRAFVKNSGDTLWKASVANRNQPIGEVHLGVSDWLEVSSGKSLKESQPQLLSRGLLPYDVAPGEEVILTMGMRTPDLAGEFLVQFDLVSEQIRWFSTQGSPLVAKKIMLK